MMLAADDAGAGCQEIDRTQVIFDGRDHGGDRRFVGDVGLVGAASTPCRLDEASGLGCGSPVADVVDGDRRPAGGQAHGDRPADAAGAAGDQRRPCGEILLGHDLSPISCHYAPPW